MNVCLLTEKYPPDHGGLAISTQRLARALAKTNIRVVVCVPSSSLAPGEVRITSEGQNHHIYRIGAYRRTDDTFADWFDLVCQLHAETPFQIIHGYYVVGAGFLATFAGRYLNIPSIVSARGNDLDRAVFDPQKAGHIFWTLQHANIITAVSSDLARKAKAVAPNADVQVIFNSVDSGQFHPLERAENPVPIVGFVGEARIKKGLTILLEGMARVAESRPVRLMLIGGVRKDDADILRVFQPPANLIIETISYTDHAQLVKLYQQLDILALPSLRDGLPNALLEGMACGCAVVASRVGGIPDALIDGKNGILIPPGDPDALVNAINALLDSPERRAELGRAAREHILQHFGLERELGANLMLYERLKR